MLVVKWEDFMKKANEKFHDGFVEGVESIKGADTENFDFGKVGSFITLVDNFPTELKEGMLVRKEVAENQYYIARSSGIAMGRKVATAKIASRS